MKKQIINPILRQPFINGIEPIWNCDSKILMLGSITATDGVKKGFYYASQRNQFWQLLDCILKTSCFSDLKEQLKVNFDNYKNGLIDVYCFETNKAKIRQVFSDELIKRKIAICDVFLQCYFNNNSSLDNDIILNNSLYPVITNKETIKKIIDNSQIKYVVVNSRFVQNQFKKMNINGDFEVKYVISPSPRKGSIDSKISSWKSVLSECDIDNSSSN